MQKEINQARYNAEQAKIAADQKFNARVTIIGQEKVPLVLNRIEQKIAKAINKLRRNPDKYKQRIIKRALKGKWAGLRLVTLPDPAIPTMNPLKSLYFFGQTQNYRILYYIPNYEQKVKKMIAPYQEEIEQLFPDCSLYHGQLDYRLSSTFLFHDYPPTPCGPYYLYLCIKNEQKKYNISDFP